MNKSDILANINSKIDTGGGSTALEVRGVLGVDSESLLEAIYADVTTDSNTLEVKTISNSNFTYSIVISKVGRHVLIEGIATALSNSGFAVFAFSDDDIKGSGKGSASNINNGDSIPIAIKPTGFSVSNQSLLFVAL